MGLGSPEPLVTPLSTNQYITLFYMYFCSRSSYLIYIVDSLILNLWPGALYVMPEQSLCTVRHFNTIHGAILNSEITHQTGHKCDTK